ncbi:MAG: hypothetical protein AAFQ87_00245 [Bacteroidota bacterium]
MKIKYLFLTFSVLWVASCERSNPEPPENPFDKIVYPEPPSPLPEPDSSSIVGLHKYIFSVSCAVPGCHDGHFEPDFRTVQSTYSTLVYQPVVKNTSGGDYTYRVVPQEPESSWLYNRVTTEDQLLGRMPLYDNPLTEGQTTAIRQWIDKGAPDMFGNAASFPNRQPTFTGVAAFVDFNGFEYRVDTIRGDEPYFPFAALANQNLDIWLAMEDDSTEIGLLQNTSLRFTDRLDGYDDGLEVAAVYHAIPKMVPDYYGPGEDGLFYWSVSVNTANVPKGKIDPNAPDVSMFRLSTSDGDNAEPFLFPRINQPIEFKFYMAFFIV